MSFHRPLDFTPMTNHPLDDAAEFDREARLLKQPPPVSPELQALLDDGRIARIPRAARVDPTAFTKIADELFSERLRQEKKHGKRNLQMRSLLSPIGSYRHWREVLGEELGEASKAYLEGDLPNLRTELVQCAAVLVAMIEYGDADGWFEPPMEEAMPSTTPREERRRPNNELTRQVWKTGPNVRKDLRLGQAQRRQTCRRSGEVKVFARRTPMIEVVYRHPSGKLGHQLYFGIERRSPSGRRRQAAFDRRES